MDFAMRYDRWYRPLATAMGLGPKRTTIRVDDETLLIKHGWAFRLDVPLKNITSARRISGRPFGFRFNTKRKPYRCRDRIQLAGSSGLRTIPKWSYRENEC